MSLALNKKYNFDKIYLIGTAHSMWEEVYTQFKAISAPQYDMENPDEIYYDILDACDNNNHKSDLSIPHKEKIEAAMPKGSKIILIKYGLNENEIKENTNIILSLADDIKQNDELVVDVTHSFRSLPLVVMQLIMYLRNVKSNINISHIYYGMLDIARETDYKIPIVDLKSLLNVNDWIIGAYSFMEFGSAYKISELMEEEEKSDAKRLHNFSDSLNLNYLNAIQSEAQSLSALKNKEYPSKLAGLVVTPTILEFVRQFGKDMPHSEFQLKLAEWQFKHRNYTASYISLVESIVTFVCELNRLKINSRKQREKAKKILWGDEPAASCPQELIGDDGLFTQISNNRNSLAHNTLNNSSNNKEMIGLLENSLKEFREILFYQRKKKDIF